MARWFPRIALRLTYETALYADGSPHCMTSPQQMQPFGNNGLLSSTLVTIYPSRLRRWRTDSRSLFSIITFSHSFSLRISMAGGQLSSPQHVLVAGAFDRLPPLVLLSQYLPSRVRSDTVWLVAASSSFFGSLLDSFYNSSLVVRRPFLI